MKKLILFIPVFLLALSPLEIKLIEKVLTTIFNKEKVYIYYPLHLNSNKLITTSCKKADVVLGDFHCNKPKFVFSYETFLKDKNAIGAFYWRKGRPQLRIKLKTIKKYHLHLTKDLMDFAE